MSVVASFFKGMLSAITVTAAPQIYRYPYRSSAEGLRGDMQRIGGDIEAVMEQLSEYTQHNRKRKPRG